MSSTLKCLETADSNFVWRVLDLEKYGSSLIAFNNIIKSFFSCSL
jgi:hypothetical protein